MVASLLEETLVELAERSDEALWLVFLYGLTSVIVVGLFVASFFIVAFAIRGRRTWLASLAGALAFFLGELKVAFFSASSFFDESAWLRISPQLSLAAGALAFGLAVHRLYFQPGLTPVNGKVRPWWDVVAGTLGGAGFLLLVATLFPYTFAIALEVGADFAREPYARHVATRFIAGQAAGFAIAGLAGVALTALARHLPRVYEYVEIISAIVLAVGALVLAAIS